MASQVAVYHRIVAPEVSEGVRPDFRRARLEARRLLTPNKFRFPVNPLSMLWCNKLVAAIWWRDFAVLDGVVVPVPGTGRYLVILNNRHRHGSLVERRRLRWTVAHELGHIVLNHVFRFPRYQMDPREKRCAEVEANTFAEELLMPTSEIIRQRHRSIDELMEYFGLNRPAIERRLERLTSYISSVSSGKPGEPLIDYSAFNRDVLDEDEDWDDDPAEEAFWKQAEEEMFYEQLMREEMYRIDCEPDVNEPDEYVSSRWPDTPNVLHVCPGQLQLANADDDCPF